MPSAVVVGGAGFVGSHIARRLSRTFDVTVVDVKEPTAGLKWVRCDVRDRDALARALRGADVVVYSAIVQIPAINEDPRGAYEVNIAGLQAACEAVYRDEGAKGLLLTGSWHVYGEAGLSGKVSEDYGYRPDTVEERARKYSLSKVCQEVLVRLYDEMSDKVFGVVRMGTALGEGMPRGTAASIFIRKAVSGEPITPFKHSMYRPMLYVDVEDVARAFEAYVLKIVKGELGGSNSLDHVINVFWPEPMTILDLANTIRDLVRELSGGRIDPEVKVVDRGLPELYTPDAKEAFRGDVSKLRDVLGIGDLRDPRETLADLVRAELRKAGHVA